MVRGRNARIVTSLAVNAAGGNSTTTITTTMAATTRGKGTAKQRMECQRLADEHAQVEYEQDQLQVVRQDRNRYEGYVRDDFES